MDMSAYGESPNALLNLREAAEHPWMGLTALLNHQPYLVIGKDGHKFVLEGEQGDIQTLLQFEWKDATENSRLIAASRQEGSALTKGSVLGGYIVGNVRHHEGEWYVLQAQTRTAAVPFEDLVHQVAEYLAQNPQLAKDAEQFVHEHANQVDPSIVEQASKQAFTPPANMFLNPALNPSNPSNPASPLNPMNHGQSPEQTYGHIGQYIVLASMIVSIVFSLGIVADMALDGALSEGFGNLVEWIANKVSRPGRSEGEGAPQDPYVSHVEILPFHSILARLEDHRYDPLKLAWDIRSTASQKSGGPRYDGGYSCPECGGDHPVLDHASNEAVCQECGYGGPSEEFLHEPADIDGSHNFDWYPDWEGPEENVTAKLAGDVQTVVSSTLENGGGTYDPISLDAFAPTSGFFASKSGLVIEQEQFTPEYLAGTLKTLALKPGEFLGTWVDGNTVYIDPARWFEDQGAAMQFAAQNAQQAIWDVAKDEAVSVQAPVQSKTASTFEMILPPAGVHLRTGGALMKEGLQCTVSYPPIPAYPDGLVVTMPGDRHAAIDSMDYLDEIEDAGGEASQVRIQVTCPDGQEDQVRAVINRLGGAPDEQTNELRQTDDEAQGNADLNEPWN